jgi:hypothetical protein
MSLPTAVFLDTSIFAEQQYNFNSVAFVSFVPAAQTRGVILLIPDPTIREVRRQIKQRSEDALKALDEARRKAPFLKKWKHFPAEPSSRLRTWDVNRIAEEEWKEFLGQFKVIHLGYENVPIATVMDWYDAQSAPFSERKRKEFPDAFAMAALLGYTIANSCSIAVVSKDNDFKLACDRFHSLLYFPSLPHLTELLLLNDERLEEVRGIIRGSVEAIQKRVLEVCEQLAFFHHRTEVEITKNVLHSVLIPDVRVVGIGHGECTITFDGKLESEHYMEWHELIRAAEDEYETHGGWIVNHSQITGVAKLALDLDGREPAEIRVLELETTEVEIDAVPTEYGD